MNTTPQIKRMNPLPLDSLHSPGASPASKKPCFKNRGVQVCTNKTDNFQYGYQGCIGDLGTLYTARMINYAAATGSAFSRAGAEILDASVNNIDGSTLAAMESLRDVLNHAILLANRTKGTSVLASPVRAPRLPDSPVSLSPSVSPCSSDSDDSCSRKFTATTDGVVHGRGVIATQKINKGEVLCRYDGALIYRILSMPKRSGVDGRYYVFTVDDQMANPEVRFLEKDTYVAWLGIFIEQQDKCTPIELGRDCDHDMQFLNHSKSANVFMPCPDVAKIKWRDRNELELKVIALRDIEPGEELLLDYEPDKPDSEIDFNASSVKEASNNIKRSIRARINNLHNGVSEPKLKPTGIKKNHVVKLPEELDKVIGEIIDVTNEFYCKNEQHIRIDELMERANEKQKNILKSLFLPEDPDIKAIADHLFPEKNSRYRMDFMEKLSAEGVKDLKQYLCKVYFNGKQTWIKVPDIQQYFNNNP